MPVVLFVGGPVAGELRVLSELGDYHEVLSFDGAARSDKGFDIDVPIVGIGKSRYRLEKLYVGGEILHWYVYDELSIRQAFELVVLGYVENLE